MSNVWITDKDFSCSLAATSNITLSGLYTLDGVAITAGMTVLAAGQTDSTASGPYIAKLGVWDRVVSLATGQQFYIALGSTNGTKIFELQTPIPFTVGVTSLSFVTPIVSGTPPIGTAGGDLSGTYPNPLVVKLRGKSIPSAAPTTGDYLNYDGTSWIYVAGTSGPPTGAAGGNLSGSYPNPKVIKVQDEAVSATPPTDGQVWVYDGVTTNSWVPTSPTSITANAGSIATYPVAATTPTSGTVLGYTGSTYAPMALPLGTGNILPPSLAGVDYFAGSMGKAAFLTYGDVASYVTVDNLAVIRGNNWTSAGHMRFDDTKRPGWIVFQRSNDAPFILFFSKGLTAPTSDTAIWITNSFDDCDAKTNGATLSFLFSQTMTGTLDPNNFYGLEISSTANINEWIVSTVKVVAGVTTTLSTLTFISNTYPAPLVCLERHSSTFRAWIGRDKDSMKQVAADATIAITPDRLSMTCISYGRPNTVFGINQILRTSEALI